VASEKRLASDSDRRRGDLAKVAQAFARNNLVEVSIVDFAIPSDENLVVNEHFAHSYHCGIADTNPVPKPEDSARAHPNARPPKAADRIIREARLDPAAVPD
jgi:hypothetical protein